MAGSTYHVSKDGKTVSIGGKTLSISAFKNQHKPAFQGTFTKDNLKPGATGTAYGPASQRITQVSAKTADEAKAKYDKKAAKKAASSLKAASKPSVSSSADAARAAAAKRALATAPSARTAAQKAAIARTTGGITGANAKKVNPVYRMMGRGGGAGGAFIENLK